MNPEKKAPKIILPSTRFAKILAYFLLALVLVLAGKRFLESHTIKETKGLGLTIVKNPESDLNDVFSDPVGGQLLMPNEDGRGTSTTQGTGDTTPPDNSTSSTASSPDSTPTSPTPSKVPVITSISSTTFGNGDTVLVSGRNFTSSNTVLVSIDLKKKFTRIAAATPESLKFTANLTFSTNLRKDLSALTPEKKAQIIQLIKDKAIGGVARDGGYYLPATISVKNAYGTSNKVRVQIDILKGV